MHGGGRVGGPDGRYRGISASGSGSSSGEHAACLEVEA